MRFAFAIASAGLLLAGCTGSGGGQPLGLPAPGGSPVVAPGAPGAARSCDVVTAPGAPVGPELVGEGCRRGSTAVAFTTHRCPDGRIYLAYDKKAMGFVGQKWADVTAAGADQPFVSCTPP